MARVQAIMAQAEANGTDPEEQIREIVTSVVAGTAEVGRSIGQDQLEAESEAPKRRKDRPER